MKLTWLGHAGFRLEIGDQILLIDPWFTGNPVFPAERRAEATAGVTAVLVSHGHGDHSADGAAVAKELGVPLAGMNELALWLGKTSGCQAIGFNKGGTIRLGSVGVTMVPASHSSSIEGPDGPVYMGAEVGFVLDDGERRLYFSGDTDVIMDMELVEALHQPEIGILCAGGHYTMDMKRASYAAKRFFNFKTVVPCHYKTFPLLEQSAQPMKDALPGVNVIEAEIMVPFEV